MTAPRAAVLDGIYAECMAKAARYPRNLADIYAGLCKRAGDEPVFPRNLADIYDRYAGLRKSGGDEPIFPKEQLPGWEKANPKPPQPPQVPTLQEMQTYVDSLGDKRRPLIWNDRVDDILATSRAAIARFNNTYAPTMPTPAQAVLGLIRMRNIAAGHGLTQDVGYAAGDGSYYQNFINGQEGQVRIDARGTNDLPHEYGHDQQHRDILAAGGPAAAQTYEAVQRDDLGAKLKHIGNMYLIQNFARNGGFNAWVDKLVPPDASAAEREAALRQIIDQTIQQHTPEEIRYQLLREREAVEQGNAAFGAPSDVNTLYDTPPSFAALYGVAADPRNTEYMPFHQDNKANWIDRLIGRLIGSYDPKRDVNSDHYDPYYNPQMQGYWDEYLYGAPGNQPDNPDNLQEREENTPEQIKALQELQRRRASDRDALMQNYDRLVQRDPEFANTPMGRYLRLRRLYDTDPANNYEFLADAAGIDESTAKSIYDRMQNAADSPLWSHKNQTIDGAYTEDPTKFPLTPGYEERSRAAYDTYNNTNINFQKAITDDALEALNSR